MSLEDRYGGVQSATQQFRVAGYHAGTNESKVSFLALLKHPSGFLPVAMSAVAVATVLITLASQVIAAAAAVAPVFLLGW